MIDHPIGSVKEFHRSHSTEVGIGFEGRIGYKVINKLVCIELVLLIPLFVDVIATGMPRASSKGVIEMGFRKFETSVTICSWMFCLGPIGWSLTIDTYFDVNIDETTAEQ